MGAMLLRACCLYGKHECALTFTTICGAASLARRYHPSIHATPISLRHNCQTKSSLKDIQKWYGEISFNSLQARTIPINRASEQSDERPRPQCNKSGASIDSTYMIAARVKGSCRLVRLVPCTDSRCVCAAEHVFGLSIRR